MSQKYTLFNTSIHKVVKASAISSVILIILVFADMLAYKNGSGFLFLIWNLFLAWIPLLLSLSIYRCFATSSKGNKNNKFLLIFGFLWFITYPNAPYVVTDYIHLNTDRFILVQNSKAFFNSNFMIWLEFITITLAVWISTVLGFFSLYIVQKILTNVFNKWLGLISVATVCLLSGFAIYLGRFIRLNSWDILLNPIRIINNLNYEAVKFSILFGSALAVSYYLLYSITSLPKLLTNENG